MPSLTVMTNFKKAVQMEQLASDAGWGAGAAASYALIPSFIAKVFSTNMDGWKGWITAVLSTWGTGAAFDIPQMRSGAWTLGSMHLMYAYDIPSKFGLNMWIFNDGSIGSSLPASAPGKTWGANLPADSNRNSYQGDDGLQPGAQVVMMPDGSQHISYPEDDPNYLQEPREEYAQTGAGMNDFFMTGQTPPMMKQLDPYDLHAM